MGKKAQQALRKAALGGSIGPAPKSHKITGEFRDPGERPHGQPWLRPWYASPRKIEEAIGTRREDDGPPIIPRVHSIAGRADGGKVDRLDRALLAAMRGLESVGAVDTPLRLFNDVVQRGRREPITERDFEPDEINALREIVHRKGGTSGTIDYPDYGDSDAAPKNALGGFKYEVDPQGGIDIADRYDFNTDRASPYEDNLAYRLARMLLVPRDAAASIGRRTVPPGTGPDVRLRIPGEHADGGSVSEFDDLDPIEREKIRLAGIGTVGGRRLMSDERAKILRDNFETVLGMLPGTGNAMSAADAYTSGGEMFKEGRKGNIKRALLRAAETGLNTVGAVTGIPGLKLTGPATKDAMRTANVFVPAQPSKTADLAREMRGNDVPNRQIFKQTNRLFMPSGRLAAEVPDKPMVIKRSDLAEGDTAPMGDVIDHPALFGVRPEMRDIPVNFTRYGDARGHPIARTSRLGGYEISSGRDDPFYREQFAKLLNYDAAGKGGFGGAVLHDIHDQFKAYDDALRMAEDIVANPKPADDVVAALAYIDRLRPMHQRLAAGMDAQGVIRDTARRGGPADMDDAMELSRLRGEVEDATRAGNRHTVGNLESRLVRMRSQRDIGGPTGLDRYPYEQGVRIGEIGPNWSKAQVIPNRDMDRDAAAALISDWHKFGIGNPRKFANGGRAKRVGRALRRAANVTVGAVSGNTPGRADALKVRVPAGSYVVPADVVAALGEGNSAAGLDKLGKQFPAKRANGGAVPIQISDGEFVIGPDAIAALGGGDADYGHSIMDAFVLQTRRDHINHLNSLPGPNQ
jgi:hypothetical protein